MTTQSLRAGLLDLLEPMVDRSSTDLSCSVVAANLVGCSALEEWVRARRSTRGRQS